MSIDSYPRARRFAVGVAACVGLTSLSGCATYNYEGTGNEFVVQGPVSSVESDGTIHIQEDNLQVLEADGKASSWFVVQTSGAGKDMGKGQDFLSDEFNFEPYYNEKAMFPLCEKKVEVGQVYDYSGARVAVTGLAVGSMVVIEGSIRDSRDSRRRSCGKEDYPVYDTVSVVSPQ